MHRLGLTFTLAVVAAASFGLGGATAAAEAAQRCKIDGRYTVLRSAKVVVYRSGTGGRSYRACWISSGRVTRLSVVPGRNQVDAISGRFLAYRFTQTDFREGTDTYIRVLDVRSGKFALDTTALEDKFGGTPPEVSPVRLLPDGTAAWAARDADDAANNWSVSLARAGQGDDFYELDRSPLIDPDSLALVPGFVYWMNDDVPQQRAF